MIGKMKYRMNTERRSSRKTESAAKKMREDIPQPKADADAALPKIKAGAAFLKSGTDAVQSKARAGASFIKARTETVRPKTKKDTAHGKDRADKQQTKWKTDKEWSKTKKSVVQPEAKDAAWQKSKRDMEQTQTRAKTDRPETDAVMPKMEEDAALPKIEGRNAVLEAFRSGKTVDKLFVLDGCKDGPVQTIIREARKQDTIIHFVDKERLNQISETKKHQGVIAVTAAYEYASVEDILAKAEEKGEDPFLILLDNIEDPHNLGAIIRTANLAGVHGIIIPKRRAVGLTGTVAKASAGAVSYTPVAKVTNLNQTIKDLKKRGIWFVCADMDGEQMYRQNLRGPVGLVIGGEGDGVSRLVKENCDLTASIPMKGEIDSLNASAAAAVLAYEIVRQRAL